MNRAQPDPEELAALIEAYARLRPGQSRSDVAHILGPPTSQRTIFGKTNSEPRGTSFEYKLTSHGSTPNVNDVLLVVVFDIDDQLIGTQPQNIPGLQPLPADPSQQ